MLKMNLVGAKKEKGLLDRIADWYVDNVGTLRQRPEVEIIEPSYDKINLSFAADEKGALTPEAQSAFDKITGATPCGDREQYTPAGRMLRAIEAVVPENFDLTPYMPALKFATGAVGAAVAVGLVLGAAPTKVFGQTTSGIDNGYVLQVADQLNQAINSGIVLPGIASSVVTEDPQCRVDMLFGDARTKQNQRKTYTGQWVDGFTGIYGDEVTPETIDGFKVVMANHYNSPVNSGVYGNHYPVVATRINEKPNDGKRPMDFVYPEYIGKPTDRSRTRGLGKQLAPNEWHLDLLPNTHTCFPDETLATMDLNFLRNRNGTGYSASCKGNPAGECMSGFDSDTGAVQCVPCGGSTGRDGSDGRDGADGKDGKDGYNDDRSDGKGCDHRNSSCDRNGADRTGDDNGRHNGSHNNVLPDGLYATAGARVDLTHWTADVVGVDATGNPITETQTSDINRYGGVGSVGFRGKSGLGLEGLAQYNFVDGTQKGHEVMYGLGGSFKSKNGNGNGRLAVIAGNSIYKLTDEDTEITRENSDLFGGRFDLVLQNDMPSNARGLVRLTAQAVSGDSEVTVKPKGFDEIKTEGKYTRADAGIDAMIIGQSGFGGLLGVDYRDIQAHEGDSNAWSVNGALVWNPADSNWSVILGGRLTVDNSTNDQIKDPKEYSGYIGIEYNTDGLVPYK